MINIIYEDNHLLVVEKPFNIPTQGDDSKDNDLLNMLKDYLKNKYNKPGNVYLGLVHRLDRPASGIMVFAKTSKAAARLTKQIQEHIFEKKYLIVTEGEITKNSDILVDWLLKDNKTNISKVVSENTQEAKKAILSYSVIENIDNLNLIEIDLKTGRSHQIRVQMSHHHMPLYGDNKYNQNSKAGEQLALFAYKLAFNHPITDERIEFKLDTPNTYPWDLFKTTSYK